MPPDPPAATETLAAVDIGTNSLHGVVARMSSGEGGPRFEILEREKEMVRLGSSGGDMRVSIGGRVLGLRVITMAHHARLTMLNGRNEVVAQLGDDENWRQSVLADNFAMRGHPEQWRPGRFVHPHDARFDAEGNIYVAEWVRTGRITKLIRKT